MRVMIFFVLVLVGQTALSQIVISNGSVNTCSDTLYDSGGDIANYSNNESFVYTICPDSIGKQSNLYFSSFDLGSGDMLCIYSGSTTSSELIGCYMNDELDSVNILHGNACLTLEFTSDGANTGSGFVAYMVCSPFCQGIESSLTSTPDADSSNIIGICPGEQVVFDANISFPQNNQNYNQSINSTDFNWNFGNDSSSANITDSVTYAETGLYSVSLNITDTIGCEQEKIIGFVLVSGPANLNYALVSNDTVCPGDTVSFLIDPAESIQTSFVFDSGGAVALPDGDGTSYQSSFMMANVGGATINELADISSICVDIEHSYMRDLEIKIVCPNGQEAVLNQFVGANGQVFLGIPVEGDIGGTPVPGTPFTYCWNMATGTDTWIEYADANSPSTLPAGDYLPFESFSNLFGCPVEGEWELIITDSLLSDNGVLFSWGLDFGPSIFPDSLDFTVPLTSINWYSETDLLTDTTNLSLVPANDTTYSFTITTTDAFGCMFDTEITQDIEVMELQTALDINQDLCDTNEQATITVQLINSTGPFNYDWSTGATTNQINNLGVGLYSVTTTDVFGCTSTNTGEIVEGSNMLVSVEQTDLNCFGDLGGINLTVTNGLEPYNYEWEIDSTLTTNVSNLPAGTYNVSVSDTVGCVRQLAITLTQPDSLYVLDTTITSVICNGESNGSITINTAGGVEPYNYEWSNNVTNNSITNLMANTYTVTITDANLCSFSENYVVTEPSIPVVNNLTIRCLGEGVTAVPSAAADSFIWGNTNCADTNFCFIESPGLYSLQTFDINGCTYSNNFEVFPATNIPVTIGEGWSNCGEYVLEVTNVNETSTYEWSEGTRDTAIIVTEPGAYSILADDGQCISRDELMIFAIPALPEDTIPNVFTPNNDNINDEFYIKLNPSIRSNNFVIYSRWGKEVFAEETTLPIWDGINKGSNESKEGSYYWILNYTELCTDKNKVLTGNVTLLK